MHRRRITVIAIILSVSLAALFFAFPHAGLAGRAGSVLFAAENTTPEGETVTETPAATDDSAATPGASPEIPAETSAPETEPADTTPTEPVTEPTDEPTEVPTEEPTEVPTEVPTETPTPEPTPDPLPSVEPHVNTVRIGLKFDRSALDVVTTGSDTGGTIGIVKNNKDYYPVLTFGTGDSVAMRADSGYHIVVTPPMPDVETARTEMLRIKTLMDGAGTSMLYIYDGSSWYIGAGFYTSSPAPGVPDVNGSDKYTVLSERLSGAGYTLSALSVRNNAVKVYINSSPVMILNVSDSTNKVRVTPLPAENEDVLPALLKLSAARYRGYFDVHRYQGGKLVLVNDVDVEDYTLSVVPAEMISGSASSWSWRKEGLKAQAILSRTSAYTYVISGKMTQYGFHMDDTTNYQVYGGYTNSSGEPGETNNTTMATRETAGLVLSYKGSIVEEVFYHSNSGGYTESPDAVWGGEQEIFVAIPDPWTVPALWTREYTGQTLNTRIVSYISNQKGIDLGTLKYLNVVSRTESGRAVEMKFEGTKNDAVVKIQQTRLSINVRGQRFIFDVDETLKIEYQSDSRDTALSDRARKYLEGNVYSTAFLPDMYAVRGNDGYTYERIRIRGASDPKQIMIRGEGTGHGVGMSQDGAEAMSKAGKTFEEIILFYIPKVQITDVSTLL
ncbi:MAG: SpoIID/LytB domain-containing protein [Clostridia bacterium]|nr:SpoIID/LytB domain-containing protein [Clostridia bacterium]